VPRTVLEPVRGLSEKQKRSARDEGLRLQRIIAQILAEQRATSAAALAACLNIGTIQCLTCGIPRAQFLEMMARVYGEASDVVARVA